MSLPPAGPDSALWPTRMREPKPPVIRPATPNDLNALSELENLAFDADRISRRSFRSLLRRKTAATLVAESGGMVAGYAMLLFRKGTAMARLYSLAVHPEMTNRGIGRALLAASEEDAFRHGRMLLRLEVREDNSNAIALYRKQGYRPIGRYLDYYDDHSTALRFEKTLRGDVPLETAVPYYEQTVDFTCGPACLMMALAHFKPDYTPCAVDEIRLWKEATTVFMMSGPGGCEPHGLAVAAVENGLAAEIHVSRKGPLFLKSVRGEEKRKVMALAQEGFRLREKELGIPVHYTELSLQALRAALRRGYVVIVLVSGYHMFGKRVPHWVLAHGDDGRHILIHDPWVEEEVGETLSDAANLPVPHEQFRRMSGFGREKLKATVILKPVEAAVND